MPSSRRITTDSMADYTEGQKQVNQGYKAMDKALQWHIQNWQVWRAAWDFIFDGAWGPLPIPGRFLITAENGDKIDINISARATLIQRALPKEE